MSIDPSTSAEGGTYSSGTASPSSPSFTHVVTASGAAVSHGRAAITSALGDAIYGSSIYGQAYYGGGTSAPPAVPPYTGSIDVTQYDHSTVHLSWDAPVQPDWDGLRLVRSTYGYPSTFTDGDILLDQSPPGAYSTTYTDLNRLPGKRYYYALYLFDGLNWHLAAGASVLIPNAYGSADAMWDKIPEVWRTVTTDAGLSEDNPALRSFIDLFGYYFDTLRTRYESMADINDPDKMAAEVLQSALAQVGWPYESAFGDRTARVMLRNAGHLSRLRGTEQGVKDLVSALTGWTATMDYSVNKMLSTDQSSFEYSLSTWGPGNGYTDFALGNRGGLQSLTDSRVYSRNVGMMTAGQAGTLQVNSVAAPALIPTWWWGRSPAPWFYWRIGRRRGHWPYPDIYTQLSATPEMLHVGGVPVKAGQPYTASAYFRSKETNRSSRVSLFLYDVGGQQRQSATSGAVATTTTDWSARPTVTLTPAQDGFAVVGGQVDSAAIGEHHYIDAVQVEQAGAASAYAMPRWMNLHLSGTDLNRSLRLARLHQMLGDYLPVGLDYSMDFTPA